MRPRLVSVVAVLVACCTSCTPTDRDIERRFELDQRTIPPLNEAILDFRETHGRWPRSLKVISSFAADRGQRLDLSRIESIELEPTAIGTHGRSAEPDSGLSMSYNFRSSPGLPGGGGVMIFAARGLMSPTKMPAEPE